MSINRHEPFEELISASLTGDLTADERARLDAHLDGCTTCRATLAAFADQRRIVAGLRHVPPPSDLGARVRAGIEGGSNVGLPWWRRPQAIFAAVGGGLAVVAGALLALVVLSGSPDRGVGEATPTVSASAVTPSDSPIATLPPVDGASPSATPVESPAATSRPEPTATPIPPSAEPDLFLALTGELDNQLITVRDGETGSLVTEVGASAIGPPIAAELSPDGQWLAHIVQIGESGLNEVRATRVSDGETVSLGESIAGSPFLEQMFWSADSRSLAYTLSDVGGGGTDVWIFRPETEQPQRLTDTGDAYAGSWTLDDSPAELLWVSRAGETPRSYLVTPPAEGEGPVDPDDSDYPHAREVFQPMVSPNGALVIFWDGRMARAGDEWLFSEGAQPWIAEHRADGQGGFAFEAAQRIFTDLHVGREAFTSAAITWGLDSNSFAVWAVQWTGTSQGTDEAYPNDEDVYFGYATDPRHITRTHAIDDADIPEGARAVDVKLPATGRHLVITVAHPRGGVLDPPRADLVLVTRNTGTVADVVEPLEDDAGGWYGPAALDAGRESEAP